MGVAGLKSVFQCASETVLVEYQVDSSENRDRKKKKKFMRDREPSSGTAPGRKSHR